MNTVNEVRGGMIDDWLRSCKNATERLHRLIELDAPNVVVSNEIILIRQALEAIEAIRGDAAGAQAFRTYCDENPNASDEDHARFFGLISPKGNA